MSGYGNEEVGDRAVHNTTMILQRLPQLLGAVSVPWSRVRLSIFATVVAVGWALVARGEPGVPTTSGDAREGASIAAGGEPRVVQFGEVSADTLDAARSRVMSAAIAALEDDEWRIKYTNPATGRIVTHWKPMKHFLARIFMSGVRARCVVDVTALGPDRSRLAIRGGLAADSDLANNPGLPAARRAYVAAAQKYHQDVREKLLEERGAVGAHAGESRAVGAPTAGEHAATGAR